MPQQPRGRDAILPAVLEFREDTESAFFNALTINLDPSTVNFKLAPTYTLYMATRYTVQKVHTEMGHERNKNFTHFLRRSLLNNFT
jgi:afadin